MTFGGFLLALVLVCAVGWLGPVMPRDELVPIACQTPHAITWGGAEDAPAMAMDRD